MNHPRAVQRTKGERFERMPDAPSQIWYPHRCHREDCIPGWMRHLHVVPRSPLGTWPFDTSKGLSKGRLDVSLTLEIPDKEILEQL